jgi:hypothetical protein
MLVTAKVVPSSPILVTLMMDLIRSSESSNLTRATQRNIPEDGILHTYRREKLKSHKVIRLSSLGPRNVVQATAMQHLS